MSTNRTGRVLVATSGSASSRTAIEYAAREALARDATLELVHVITPPIATGPYGMSPDVALRETGREVLDSGERLAQRVAPALEVTTSLLTGSRPDAVVHAAEGADLVVVGTPPHDLMGRLWSGSTVMGIAARSTCPVLVVPPRAHSARSGRVLVGVKTIEHCDHLLASAFAMARQTQSEIEIVHAWHMVTPYEDAIVERLPTPQWEANEIRAIEAHLIDLRMTYPEVRVHVTVVHGRPAPTLAHASRDADVLVISRPLHGGYLHHLGATARTLIREAGCPVLVVPATKEATGAEPSAQDTSIAS